MTDRRGSWSSQPRPASPQLRIHRSSSKTLLPRCSGSIPARQRGTISPTVQSMTVNAGGRGGPPVDPSARGLLRRVAHGYYEFNPRVHRGAAPSAPRIPSSPPASLMGGPAPTPATPLVVAQEELQTLPGDAREQRAAEAQILGAASAHLGETLALFEQHIAPADMPRVIHQEIWPRLPADPRVLRVLEQNSNA